MEAEVRDALGREYYEHGEEPGRGYRNGVRPGRLKTAEGFIEYAAPQVAESEGEFSNALFDELQDWEYKLKHRSLDFDGLEP